MGEFIGTLLIVALLWLAALVGHDIGKVAGEREVKAQAVHRGLAEWKADVKDDGTVTTKFSWTSGHD